MRRTKKGSISYYRKKCDNLIGLIVRSRGRCERCGRTDTLQHAHVVPRTNMTLRWDEQNGLCLCYRHHLHWAHKDPIDFTNWFKKKYPDRYEYLQSLRNKITKRTLDDYKHLFFDLKDRSEEVGTNSLI